MFHSARLKLTAWYLTMIMVVSITFSLTIYRMLTGEIERFERRNRFRIEHRLEQGLVIPEDVRLRNMMTPLSMTTELIEETKQRIRIVLILVNAGILVLAGGMGYILAGRTLRPIQIMMDEQRRFVSDASHELRTPLTSLKSAFEVFLREKAPIVLETKTLVKESLTEVEKLQSLTESLLTLAQQTQPNSKPILQKISLTDVASDAIRKISPMAKKKHIRIKKNIADCVILGNHDSLTQLLIILLDNAVKYSTEKTLVHVSITQTKGSATVEVADQGTGISHEDLPHIFDRFWRADNSRSKTNGYGLGLSIAKKIVELHSGTIRVTSKLGKGTTCIVRFPQPQFFS